MTPHAGSGRSATAYWTTVPGTGELRVEQLPPPGPGEVLDAGFRVRWISELTRAHQRMAQSLLGSFTAHEPAITDGIGPRALTELLAAHRLWADWLGRGRVRKFALVAERDPTAA